MSLQCFVTHVDLSESRAQLVRSFTVFVQTVIPLDASQDLQIAAAQPVAGVVDHLQEQHTTVECEVEVRSDCSDSGTAP